MAPKRESTKKSGLEVSVENQVDLMHLRDAGMNVQPELRAAGWINFFERKTQVRTEMIKELWKNAIIGDDVVETKVMTFTVMISADTISEAVNCPNEGLVYQKGWEASVGGLETVRRLLMKPEVVGIWKASNMKDKVRVFHKLLNKMVLPIASSRDSVNDVHKFCLFHLLKKNKINLPMLIFENMKRELEGRTKSVSIPYGATLTRLLIS